MTLAHAGALLSIEKISMVLVVALVLESKALSRFLLITTEQSLHRSLKNEKTFNY